MRPSVEKRQTPPFTTMPVTAVVARGTELRSPHLCSFRTKREVDDASSLIRKPTEDRGDHSNLAHAHLTRLSARKSIVTAAINPSDALQTIEVFVSNPSPGLISASIANTAVFTTGFSVLRLGLTLAGIAHSWFLGTVRPRLD